MVRVSQVIVAALMLGVGMFGVIAIVIGNQQPPPAGTPVVSFVMAGVAVMLLVASTAITSQVRPALNQPDELAAAWRLKQILRNAPLEGAGFANLVAYIIEQQWWSVAIAGSILLVMAAGFPTATKLRQYIETHQAFH